MEMTRCRPLLGRSPALGHRNIRSTSIYARITDRHRQEKYRALEASPWIVYPV